MPKKAALALVFALLLSTPAAAQQPTSGVVVSENICDFGAIDDLNTMVREHWAPVLDRAVREGTLTSWGVLNHLWGNEWNWVIYYGVPDANTGAQTVSRLLGEIIGAMPGDPMADFGRRCSAHRDNIYAVAVMQSAEPPGGGADEDRDEPGREKGRR